MSAIMAFGIPAAPSLFPGRGAMMGGAKMLVLGDVAGAGQCGGRWAVWRALGDVAGAGQCGGRWAVWRALGSVAGAALSRARHCGGIGWLLGVGLS